jgi:hypothetical protein
MQIRRINALRLQILSICQRGKIIVLVRMAALEVFHVSCFITTVFSPLRVKYDKNAQLLYSITVQYNNWIIIVESDRLWYGIIVYIWSRSCVFHTKITIW